MTKPLTVLDYSRRIERVIDHIGAHLDEPLDLERLAAVACFSPYHFHRIYRAVTGETLADALRRLRLHRAAGDLVQERTQIAAVARRAGYGSVAAFARAFRAGYGIPPASHRRQGRPRQSRPQRRPPCTTSPSASCSRSASPPCAIPAPTWKSARPSNGC